MLEFFKNRRTIRDYSDKDVPEYLLNELLSCACRASTLGNMQLYSIIITRSTEMKEKLAPAHFNQPMIKQAPVVLTFCADYNRTIKWCEQRQAEPGYDNFQSFIGAMSDVLIAAQAFCDAAESQGLGICYLGTTTYNASQIIEILHLPRRVVPVITITVGFPASLPEQVERLPLDAVVHHESYQDYTPELIDLYYTGKENLPANKGFVKENNKETLAQVFTDVRYPKDNNEFFSKMFLDVLRSQGFLD